MKIKKGFILIAFIAVLTGLLIATLAACDTLKEGAPGTNEYESAFYNVTFNTNGGTVSAAFESSAYKNVRYGSTIAEPVYTDGPNKGGSVRPTKMGYTFRYWSSNGTDPFRFGEGGDPITGNLTLSAVYYENVYYYDIDRKSKLQYTVNSDGSVSYDLERDAYYHDNDYDIIVPSDQLEKPTTSLKSTYNINSAFPVLTFKTAEGEKENKFCFWYYLDKDGKPVQFTKWADSESKTVETLSRFNDRYIMDTAEPYPGGNSYEFKATVTLYPMFEDALPQVTLHFLSEASDSSVLNPSAPYPINGKALTPDNPTMNERFEFVNWYYKALSYDAEGNVLYEAEDGSGATADKEKAKKDDADNYVYFYKQVEMTFATEDDDSNAVALIDVINEMREEDIDNFTPVTLNIYAKQRRVFTINKADASTSSYEDKAESYKYIYDLVRLSADEVASLSDDEKLDYSYLLDAHIKIGTNSDGSLDLTELGVLQPLFDSAHVFTGVIEGGENLTYITGMFGYSGENYGNEASVFGYNAGVIKNLTFNDLQLYVNRQADSSAVSPKAYIGAVATVNRGTIENCKVNFGTLTIAGNGTASSSDAAFSSVIFGGIVAVNEGESSSNKATVSNCEVNITNLTVDSSSLDLLFGGIAGQSSASTDITQCSAKINADTVGAAITVNSLEFGGVVGQGNGKITISNATVKIASAATQNGFTLGGIAAYSSGGIERSWSKLDLGSDGAAVSAASPRSQVIAVGGLIGANDGYVLISYAKVNIYVAASTQNDTGVIVEVGGLIGNNFSAFDDSSTKTSEGVGAINYCYAVGTVNVSATSQNSVIYVGGIAGRHRKASASTTKVNNIFANVNITVSNTESGTNNIGYLFGILGADGKDPINYGWFNSQATITLNGQAYQRTVQDNSVTENFHVDYTGQAVEGDSNFKNTGWLTNTEQEDGKPKGPNFNSEEWAIEDDYPTLKKNPESGFPAPAEPEESGSSDSSDSSDSNSEDSNSSTTD